MAMPLAVKRMARERVDLEKPNPDYFVQFSDDDILKFTAYIVGPEDSLYRFKLVKIAFEVPNNYPLVPPKCTFVQHAPGRIHPNLYVEGKVCLSILGTWEGEPWAQGMRIESVLITIRSLLDKEPYRHEPGQKNDEAFNRYVEYRTWQVLLLDHFDKETRPESLDFLNRHFSVNGDGMLLEIARQDAKSPKSKTHTNNKYDRHKVSVDYAQLRKEIQTRIAASKPAPPKLLEPAEDWTPACQRTVTEPALPFGQMAVQGSSGFEMAKSGATFASEMPVTKRPIPAEAAGPSNKKSKTKPEIIILD